MELTRRPDWQVRLANYVRVARRQQFVPGRTDCAMFAAGAVEVMTGVDLARGWRGYRSLAEGRRALAAKGFADHVALTASVLPSVPVWRARPGDVAVVAVATGVALGIFQGDWIYVMGDDGMGVVGRSQASGAFAV